MKRILILSLLFPLSIMAMEQKQQSEQQRAAYVQIKAILMGYSSLTSGKRMPTILEKDLVYMKSENQSSQKLMEETTYSIPTSNNRVYGGGVHGLTELDERRALRLTLTLKSINTDNSVDIEYSCDRESEDWRTESDTVIKTRMISAIKPNTRNIKLGADPEIVHFPMSLCSLEFSAWEQKSLSDK